MQWWAQFTAVGWVWFAPVASAAPSYSCWVNVATHPNASQVPSSSAAVDRNAGFDALRASMTLLVVFHHTAITYGAIGGWFYREVKTDGSLSSMLLVFFCTLNQAYFMGLFFLLAGYFTPAAIRSKGAAHYLGERLLRLGLPLLFFAVVLGPVTVALARTAQAKPFAETLVALWQRGSFINGPLWFAQALLLFSFAAVGWAWLRRPHVDTGSAVRPASPSFPSNRMLLLTAVGTGVLAFVLRLAWPVGTEWWGLQLGYFSSYIALFIGGCMAAQGRWLERLPPSQVAVWRRIALLCLPILPVVSLLGPAVPLLAGHPQGGWSVPAVVYALWEPLLAWGIIVVLLQRFQQRFTTLSEFWRTLSRRAYAIYVIHPPILVAVSLAWRTVPAPALFKFVVTGLVSCILCYLVAGLLLRLRWLARVL